MSSNKIGVLIIGSSGAVATTIIAGVALMRRGLTPKYGMLTEGELGQKLAQSLGKDFATVENLVFGGWDLRAHDAYESAMSHGVVPQHLLDKVKDELSAIKPWPGVASAKFLNADFFWADPSCPIPQRFLAVENVRKGIG